MSDTSTPSQAGNRVLAEQVYDLLMGEIEPELTLTAIPTLDDKYRGETPEEHESRMQRYAVAYKKFDLKFNAFMNDVNGQVRASHRKTLREQEEMAKSADENTLTSIASAFD